MSAQAALSIIGGVAGFMVGGPAGAALGMKAGLGAAIGASIGSTVGGMIGATFDPVQRFEGPRLYDLHLQSSSYGVPLPLVYGADNRIAGTLIWSTGLVETRKKKRSGGKGGGGGSSTTTYSYRTSAAISLSEGPGNNIRRIWANGKILFDIGEVTAEVTRLDAKAVAADARADDAEAASAANPDDPDLLAAAVAARAIAVTAAAKAADAAVGLADAVAGGTPWTLTKGSGLPRGPLKSLSFYPGNTTQTPDPIIEGKVGTGLAPAYRGVCYVVLGDLQLANYGNSLPNLEFEFDGLAPRTVAAILNDICERSGMAAGEYAVRSGLGGLSVDGYAVATANSAMAAITPLQGVYFFDTVEQGGEVRFVPRGLGPVSAIPLEDIAARERGDDTPERFSVTRVPDFGLPREVSVTYRDPERDYQDNTQRAVRLYGDAYSVVTLQAPITMSADAARKIADRALWEAWSSRGPAQIQVTDKYRFLFAGDVIALEVAGTWRPFRVTNRTRGSNGLIDLEMAAEDPFVYEGSTAGADGPVITNASASVGDTFVACLNTPILSTGQTSTGFGYVIDAAEDGWAGGALLRSTDGGASYSEVESSGERNTTGTVAAALAIGPTGIWDRLNTITVVLLHADHELESLPEADVLNGKNAVWLGAVDGTRGEVLQFATATLTASNPKTYVLSDLLRGRRATEHETALHGTNELFVFLESDLMRTADYDVADWDRSRRYKGVSVYDSEDDVVDYLDFTNLGERAKPRSPVHGAGERDGSNNLTLTWVRRVRGFQVGMGYGSLPLDELTESYEVDVIVGGIVKRTLTASSPTVAYSAANQTTDGTTPGNPVTVRIYQISASRGRGHKGEFTV